jgi:hypothetical protein
MNRQGCPFLFHRDRLSRSWGFGYGSVRNGPSHIEADLVVLCLRGVDGRSARSWPWMVSRPASRLLVDRRLHQRPQPRKSGREGVKCSPIFTAVRPITA